MVAVGDQLDGKYTVIRRLGAGGFGEVFLAEDRGIAGRRIAIKALQQSRPDADYGLHWEMNALAQVTHPGVVSFYHHFTSANRLFLVMEYCPGGTLRDRLLGDNPVAEKQVIEWGLALSRALAAAHARDVVHHDVKPENIFFGLDGQIKIGDFGVANRNIGTRSYLPPEMFLGEPVSRTDPRIDVYVLGITMLEALKGRQPLMHLPESEWIRARIEHAFIPQDVQRWVQDLLTKATHPTPELRFQTMEEFAEAIETKHVPHVFDGSRLKAHALAEKAQRLLVRKRWKSAEKVADHALSLSPDCVAAQLVAGRCQLLRRHIFKAEEHFMRAVTISPRTQAQKELGWLNLERGNIPAAISLLTDHLQRNSADYEAYNLLLKCYYLSGRYEAGIELAGHLSKPKARNDCFANNQFICELMLETIPLGKLNDRDLRDVRCPFATFNLEVARERPASWSEGDLDTLRSKLLFEEFSFGLAHQGKAGNILAITRPGGQPLEIKKPIVTIGAFPENDVPTANRSVSRRHAAIVNLPDEVWIYDLGSTQGTMVDGEPIVGRTFLDGVHEVDIGPVRYRIAAKASLLI